MSKSDLQIILLGGALIALIILVAVIYVGFFLGKDRKEIQERLDKLKNRHSGNQTLTSEMVKSIRRLQKQSAFAEAISGFIPKKDMLVARLHRAGMNINFAQFAGVCGIIALFTMLFFLLSGFVLPISLALGIIIGIGIPHFYVSGRITKRLGIFTKQFPDALDMIVRGLRSGLPVNECLSNVSKEIPAPIGTEFVKVIDAMRLGSTLEEALWETANRLDTADFKFFVISLSVQRETGGNLGETLANLSTILRQRQAMKLKVKAMASEAKASAWIIGILPFAVFGLMFVLNTDYVMVLFTNPTATVAVLGGVVWMSIGIAIMAKMINFEV